MQMLYDSDDFVVIWLDAHQADEVLHRHNQGKPKRDCFEIVDKRGNMSVCLTGSWAQAFGDYLARWKANTPTKDEVEEVLGMYSELSNNPLIIH